MCKQCPIECKHELEYCAIHDVVFCKKCKKEWKKETEWTYSGTYANFPNTTYTVNLPNSNLQC